MLTIWYHLLNLKNMKQSWRSVTFTKSNSLPWVFFTFLNCTNGTKSSKASHVCFFLQGHIFFSRYKRNSQERWPIYFCPFYSIESLKTCIFQTTTMQSVSFQKLFWFLKYSSFRILEYKITKSHEMRKHKITREENII